MKTSAAEKANVLLRTVSDRIEKIEKFKKEDLIALLDDPDIKEKIKKIKEQP